jgi:hypothetical protein
MVDWNAWLLHFRCTKHEERAHVPLSDAAAGAIKAVLEGGAETERVFRSIKMADPLEDSR